MSLTRLSASELARKIASGEVSALEAVEAHVRRVEEVDPGLNALVVRRFERARAEARAADEARARGEPLGRLHGVPITIKESFDVAGTPTTAGFTTLRGRIAERDGPLVARLRAAGAIVLGKTNVPQTLLLYETENPLHGLTRNPWNPARSPGGSSGGEAAAIAAGESPLGLGSDAGGSIRFPAHSSGISGLKPTSGRLSLLGHAIVRDGSASGFCQPGPLARSVEDLALALEVLAAPGLEAIDPAAAPVPWRDPASVSVRGLRVAMYADDGFFPPAPAARRAVREAAAALEGVGAAVEAFRPPEVDEALRIYFGLLLCDGLLAVRRAARGSKLDFRVRRMLRESSFPSALRPAARRLLDLLGQRRRAQLLRFAPRRAISAARYRRLLEERALYRARFLGILDAGRFDAIICPPHALPALPHGLGYDLASAGSYLMLYNLLGFPAGVVPATTVRPGEESDRPESRDRIERLARRAEAGSAGLPVGVQVAARPWREDVALAVMAALERALGRMAPP